MQHEHAVWTKDAVATVLVVEDDTVIQQLLRDLLESSGYHVEIAGTGGAALDACASTAIDLVLLDVMLPDMMGYQVCQEIRAGSLASMPIIMLTALTRPEQVNEGLLQGADDYVKKPFNPAELKLRIDRQVQRYRAQSMRESEFAELQDMLELTRRQLVGARGVAQTEATLRQEFLQKVTTHFQALSGVIEAQIRRLPPGTARDAVQQIKMRVRGAGLVYEVSAALQTDPAPMGEVIRIIVTALKSVYRPWKRVKVTVGTDDVVLPSAIAAPVAMAVNELVTNSFRHAFPENRFGMIDVSYGIADAAFWLRVRDDGVGMAETPGQTGNGMRALQQMIAGLDGTIALRAAEPGTDVMVRIPLPAPATTP